MERRSAVRTVVEVAVGITLLAATAVVLFWPGPMALDDRIPIGLLFTVPGVAVLYRSRRRTA